MQMMTMTRLMRVLIDAALLLGLCLIGAGAYFTYGLGPALLLVGDELWATYSWQRRSIALVKLALP